MDSVKNRYALALLSIAKDAHLVNEYQEQAKSVYQILKENPDYIRVLSSCFLSKEEKHALLDEAFQSLTLKSIVSFLKVVVDNERTVMILSILQEFHSLCNEQLQVAEGIVYSVMELSEQEMSDITEVISKKLKQKVELKNIIDERLLGGIKVIIQDRVFDGSILHKVEMMKKDLLIRKAGGGHGN